MASAYLLSVSTVLRFKLKPWRLMGVALTAVNDTLEIGGRCRRPMDSPDADDSFIVGVLVSSL